MGASVLVYRYDGGTARRLAGYDFERRSLAAALRGYEDWLRKPCAVEWGESDCAIVAMEPLIAAGLDRRGATPGASDRGGAR